VVFAGHLDEMMAMLGFDSAVASCLSDFIVHHAEHLARAINAASAVPAAAAD